MSLPEVQELVGAPFVTFSHVFSHYELQATVCRQWVEATSRPTSNGRWINARELSSVALPAPIEKLLKLHADVLFGNV